MGIPNDEEALALHARAGSNQRIIAHCREVARIAVILATELRRRGFQIDLAAVSAAALLHDIGRTRTNTVHHGHVGADKVRSFGVDERVARIIDCHVGAGISEEEARKFSFPPGDYVPRTLEEQVVCFSDKIVDGNNLATFELEVGRFRKKGLDVSRLMALKSALQNSRGEDPEVLVASKS